MALVEVREDAPRRSSHRGRGRGEVGLERVVVEDPHLAALEQRVPEARPRGPRAALGIRGIDARALLDDGFLDDGEAAPEPVPARPGGGVHLDAPRARRESVRDARVRARAAEQPRDAPNFAREAFVARGVRRMVERVVGGGGADTTPAPRDGTPPPGGARTAPRGGGRSGAPSERRHPRPGGGSSGAREPAKP